MPTNLDQRIYNGTQALAEKCTEENESPVENWTNGLQATVTLRCKWSDRYEIAQDIVNNVRGYPRRLSVGTGPQGQDEFIAWCTGGAIAPAGKMDIADFSCEYTNMGDYDQALITLNYSSGGSGGGGGSPGEGTIFVESFEPNAEMLKIPGEGFYYEGDKDEVPLTDQQSPSKLILSFDYIQTRFDLATIPPEVLTHVGSVNSKKIYSSLLGLTFAPKTLLFNPPTLNRSTDSQGTGKWTMTSRFSYRPETWFKYWWALSESWVNIMRPADPDAEPPETGDQPFENYTQKSFANILTGITETDPNPP